MVRWSDGTGARKRRAPSGWEAGDVRRTRTAGWGGDGSGVLSGFSGVPLNPFPAVVSTWIPRFSACS